MGSSSGRRLERSAAVEPQPLPAARVSGGRLGWHPPSAAAHASGAHQMVASRTASRRRPALLRRCSTARGQCRQVLRLPRRAATAATCGSSGHCATWWTGSRRGRAHSLQGPRGTFTWPWSENAVDSRETKDEVTRAVTPPTRHSGAEKAGAIHSIMFLFLSETAHC